MNLLSKSLIVLSFQLLKGCFPSGLELVLLATMPCIPQAKTRILSMDVSSLSTGLVAEEIYAMWSGIFGPEQEMAL
jgi:hypothetical protein